jgi:MFS family permease
MSVDSEKKNGVFIGVIYFMIYLITSRASAVSSFFDEKYKSRLPYLSLILGFGLGTISGFFYLEEIWLVAVIAFIGIYIVENIRKPVLTGYVSDHTQNEVLTSVLSAQSLLKTIMTAILAFVFGLLADQFNLGTALLIVSILLTLGTFVIHLISKSKYQSA